MFFNFKNINVYTIIEIIIIINDDSNIKYIKYGKEHKVTVINGTIVFLNFLDIKW